MKIKFKKSKNIKIKLSDSQAKQISSPEIIKECCKQENVLAFDILYKEKLIGFAMLRNYQAGKWFLWNYGIDIDYQGIGLGEKSLLQLISLMKKEYDMTVMTTTYTYGNAAAKNLYTKVGFNETDIIDEPDLHEVNMMYNCRR